MNCKPGDLAYLCHEALDAGLIVEVIASCVAPDGSPAWDVKSRTPARCELWSGRNHHLTTEFSVEDKYLRPISGVPVHDEEHNEVTA